MANDDLSPKSKERAEREAVPTKTDLEKATMPLCATHGNSQYKNAPQYQMGWADCLKAIQDGKVG